MQSSWCSAIVADALQIVVFPLFVEGALSPTDDLLDFGVGAMMVHLLGWHWEFLSHGLLQERLVGFLFGRLADTVL